MSRFSVVIPGSAIAGFPARVSGRIALGAVLCAAWAGCGSAPPGVSAAQQPLTCVKPGSGATTSAWASYATNCLAPNTTCFAAIAAKVQQSATPNKIVISTPPNQIEVDLSVQDDMEAKGQRPSVWRHSPTTPTELSMLPNFPTTTDAVILVQQSITTSLGFTPDTLAFKWPDCTALGITLSVVELSFSSITLMSNSSTYTIKGGASGAPVDLAFPNLVVRVPSDGGAWPPTATLTKINVAGSIPGHGSGSINLLNEGLVPRPQVIDLTTSPVKVTLTTNGLGRFH